MGIDSFQPLRGVRVLDLSRVLAGPLCSMVLADLGADVIKVERPGQGDDTRAWGPPFIQEPSSLGGMSAYFASVNRSKRSLSLDLARPEGREVLANLISQSDVLLENFLPSSAAKLGVTPQDLRRMNPNLVACSISGFGRTGPWSEQPGYDFIIQALSGLMSITGEPDPNAPGMKVGVALTDVLTGLYAAVSVLAALRSRGETRRGESQRAQESASTQPTTPDGSRFHHIDLALLDCTLASLVNVAQAFLVTGARPERYGNAHPQIVPYESFQTADGYVALAVGNDDQFRRFCLAARRPDVGQDPRFVTNPLRVTHRAELIRELQQLFRYETTAEWQRRLAGAGVPHAPVLSLDEVFSLPHVQARQMVLDTAGLKHVASPIHVSGTAVRDPSPPPRLGQHSEEILREFGYSSAEIQRLRETGVT